MNENLEVNNVKMFKFVPDASLFEFNSCSSKCRREDVLSFDMGKNVYFLCLKMSQKSYFPLKSVLFFFRFLEPSLCFGFLKVGSPGTLQHPIPYSVVGFCVM